MLHKILLACEMSVFSCHDETVHKEGSIQKTSNGDIQQETHIGSGFLQCVGAKIQYYEGSCTTGRCCPLDKSLK